MSCWARQCPTDLSTCPSERCLFSIEGSSSKMNLACSKFTNKTKTNQHTDSWHFLYFTSPGEDGAQKRLNHVGLSTLMHLHAFLQNPLSQSFYSSKPSEGRGEIPFTPIIFYPAPTVHQLSGLPMAKLYCRFFFVCFSSGVQCLWMKRTAPSPLCPLLNTELLWELPFTQAW